MYEENRAEIERLGRAFEERAANRSASAREAGDEYLKSLASFIEAYDHGPASDPQLAGLDTTGELERVGEYLTWAEGERTRVRREMMKLP